MLIRRLVLGILTLILTLIGILWGSQSQADESILNKLIEPVGGFINVQDLVTFAQTYKYEIDPTKRTLIIFTATYCGACKHYSPQIEELEIVKNKQVNLVYFYLPGSRNKEISQSTKNEKVSAVSYFPTIDDLMGIKVPALPRIALLEPNGCVLRFEHPLSIILQPSQLLE